jgi:hypothetical protein
VQAPWTPPLQAAEVSLEATLFLRQGLRVRSVDVKPFSEWYQVTSDAENLQLDLSGLEACRRT